MPSDSSSSSPHPLEEEGNPSKRPWPNFSPNHDQSVSAQQTDLNPDFIVKTCPERWANSAEYQLNPEEASYFFVKATDPQQKVTSLNFYVLQKTFELHGLYNLPLVKRLRNGDLLVKVNSVEQAKTLASITQLHILHVCVEIPSYLNTKQGIIFSNEAKTMSNEEILDLLHPLGVRKVIKKKECAKGTTLVILTFARSHIPERFKLGREQVRCRLYIPPPLRCHKCQEYGHSFKKI